MEYERQVDAIAALMGALPPAPGLGPIAERVRGRGLPILASDHARLLAFLAGERGTARVLVTGRSAGHAAACVAHVAPDARILIATPGGGDEALISAVGAPDRVRIVAGGATEGFVGGEQTFDLIHVDEDVVGYRRLLDLALTHTAVRGCLLWHGLPAAGPEAEAAQAFCGYLLMHPQTQATVLAVGDGLALARKSQALVTDLGGPY